MLDQIVQVAKKAHFFRKKAMLEPICPTYKDYVKNRIILALCTRLSPVEMMDGQNSSQIS